MNSPGADLSRGRTAKSFRGWLRFVAGFIRFYGIGLTVAALLLLAVDLLWPDAHLLGTVAELLPFFSPSP